jgi:hypothetical protein
MKASNQRKNQEKAMLTLTCITAQLWMKRLIGNHPMMTVELPVV